MNDAVSKGSIFLYSLQLSSGVEAGVMLVILFNPVWVVKTRLALQGAESTGHAKYNGSIGTVQRCFLLCPRTRLHLICLLH